MSHHLELLAATAWFWIFAVGFLISITTSICLLFCPTLRWAVLLYAIWIWYDKGTCERGGRPIPWVRRWSWWRHMKNYFNHKLVTDEDVSLDSNKNYLFACFPHGMLPVGTFASFVDGYQTVFPSHQSFTTVLNIQFLMPVMRELFLAVGAVSVSAQSIRYILSKQTGGNIVSILIGGADESKYSKPSVTSVCSFQMKIPKVEFAPLHVPLQRRVQTLAAASWLITLAFGGFFGFLLSLYLIVFTRLWWIVLIYCGWIYLDRDICEKGGRPINWVKSWRWWFHFRDYFPAHLAAVPNVELEKNRNYLFCCFPHGILSTGAFNAFATTASEFSQLFPNHVAKIATLHQHYFMPIFREFALSIGGISASANSINYVLNRPEGGNIVVLIPGGAAESYNSRPGQYKILVKRRKGFIKLALKTGTPLVPVISFGETDLFDQVEGPTLHRVQEFLRKIIGIAPLLFVGRGFFQYSFGIIPQRREITTLVGTPIDVTKIESPTNEQIEELHERFIQELKKIFEEYKYKYLKNPENKFLEV